MAEWLTQTMGTTQTEIRRWLEQGVSEKSTHVIVVVDTYDHEDFPVLCASPAEALKKYDEYNGKNMHRVMEVYDLALPFDDQLVEHRAFHLPQRETTPVAESSDGAISLKEW